MTQTFKLLFNLFTFEITGIFPNVFM